MQKKCLMSLLGSREIIRVIIISLSYLKLITNQQLYQHIIINLLLKMPRAKKNKVVSLTKVKKDVHGLKDSLVQKVHSYVDTFKSIYVITYENMTTNPFKALREELADCRFCLGKNKVMGVALGRTQEESYKPNLYQLSSLLKAQCCLFFTNRPHSEIKQIFSEFEIEEYAQVGTIADTTVILQKGFQTLSKFPHSMQSHFRKLGLNIRLMNSKIQLLQNYLLCSEGKPLSVNNCKILKLLGIKQGKFKLQLKAKYNTQNNQVSYF